MAKLSQYRLVVVYVMLFIGCCVIADAQGVFTLRITSVDDSQPSLEQLKLKSSFNSYNSCLDYVQQLPSLLSVQGYVAASIDSLQKDSASMHAWLYLGEKYHWKSIEMDKESKNVLQLSGYDQSKINKQPFDAKTLSRLYNHLLDYYAENGYPFANVKLDNVSFSNNEISGELKVDKGSLYRIDSIRMMGNLKISQSFLQHYLDIKKNDPYNRQKIENIANRLNELSFVEQTKPPDVTMLNTGAVINLYAQPKQSNEINVLVGLLPANEQTGGKLLLTGEAHLNLKNSFRSGETLGANWQQLQPRSPRLNLLFQKPYLFNSPFGIDFNFELYKRDSLFLNVNTSIGLQYELSSKQSGKIFLQTASSNLLDVDTLQVIYFKRLPDIIDVRSVSLGFQYLYNNTNYRYNPRRGNELNVIASAGNKKVKPNNAISQIKDASFNYKQLYDSFPLSSYQFRIQLTAAHYFPFGKQATLKTAVNSGVFQSPFFFNNEMFQIGGYRLLRGFDEESIYTNRYAVATGEYRYLLAVNSYFFAFSDFGWAAYEHNEISFSHTYLGLGIGLAFETRTGIFNISYASGKRDDAGFDLRQSKIHLGFVSLF